MSLNPDGSSSPPSSSAPLVYAVVPAFNRCEKTLHFLRHFARVAYPNKRVAICDDGSTDNTALNIRMNFPDVPVLAGTGDLWWSGGTNMAIRHALAEGADYILTINDDVHMAEDFLDRMVAVARRNPRYIVGCRLMRQDDPARIWAIGTRLKFRLNEIFALNFSERRWEEIEGSIPDPYPVATMPGNGVLIPRAVFEQVGFYDETNMPHYHADSDLVLRARARGFVPVISLESVLYNHIPTEPLVTNRRDLIFKKKSDRYYKAVWATLQRHGPTGRKAYLFVMQYLEFFTHPALLRFARRMTR